MDFPTFVAVNLILHLIAHSRVINGVRLMAYRTHCTYTDTNVIYRGSFVDSIAGEAFGTRSGPAIASTTERMLQNLFSDSGLPLRFQNNTTRSVRRGHVVPCVRTIIVIMPNRLINYCHCYNERTTGIYISLHSYVLQPRRCT